MMSGRRSTRVYVEVDAKASERVLDNLMIAVNDILWSASLLLSLDGDRHAMLIRSADIKHILTLHSQISHIYVRRHIYTCKVADMHWTIGVRKRTGHKSSVVVFAHIFRSFYIFICSTCKVKNFSLQSAVFFIRRTLATYRHLPRFSR